MIIAVDGPAAAGKGTIARALAKHFGLNFLDTGTLYRMVGLSVLQRGADASDASAAIAAAERLDPKSFEDSDLRGEDVGSAASKVAAVPGVRRALLQFQRDFASTPPGAVLDGRDIGTVVCPDADAKLFITASPEVRARRRQLELEGLGRSSAYEEVLKDILARDERDSRRLDAPLRAAPNAAVIDTSDMGIEAALDAAIAAVETALKAT
ncbi:MAG: (d)CMP kinase [Aestuariivirga sp.]